MGFFNEIDALKDHALEPFQNEPGKRRFVQIVFVLLGAAAGVGVAAGIGLAHAKLDLFKPDWWDRAENNVKEALLFLVQVPYRQFIALRMCVD